jgi:hypothetical protein
LSYVGGVRLRGAIYDGKYSVFNVETHSYQGSYYATYIVSSNNATDWQYTSTGSRQYYDSGPFSIAFDAARYGNYTVNETSFMILKGHFDAIQKTIKPTTSSAS